MNNVDEVKVTPKEAEKKLFKDVGFYTLKEALVAAGFKDVANARPSYKNNKVRKESDKNEEKK